MPKKQPLCAQGCVHSNGKRKAHPPFKCPLRLNRLLANTTQEGLNGISSLRSSSNISSATVAQLRAEEEGSQQHSLSLEAPIHPSAVPMTAGVVGQNEMQLGDNTADERPLTDSAVSTASTASTASKSLWPSNVEATIVELDKILLEPDSVNLEGTHTSLLLYLIFRQTEFKWFGW